MVMGILPNVGWSQGLRGDTQWQLAEDLFARGQYYRAITEYERFIFYFPEDPKAQLAKVRIVEAYANGRWWSEGAKEAEEALRDGGMSVGLRCRLLELLVRCLKNAGRMVDAQRELERAVDLCLDPEVKSHLQVLGAQMALEGGAWDEAASRVLSMEAAGLEGVKISNALRQASKEERDPHMAAALAALLPGLGHAYLGRWEDAGLVFLVNGAFLAATLEAIDKKSLPLAGGMALAELLWYSGNIFSALSNAHKHNKLLRQAWSKRLDPFGHGEPWGERGKDDFSQDSP